MVENSPSILNLKAVSHFEQSFVFVERHTFKLVLQFSLKYGRIVLYVLFHCPRSLVG